jgi:hypothetical protein
MTISEMFVCPRCRDNHLEEVMTDVVVASEVTEVDGDVCEYGEQTNTDGIVSHYQCADCGWTIPGVKCPEELFRWLNHGKSDVSDEDAV